jgi:membrane protein YdbS with pleckstrin-like domain
VASPADIFQSGADAPLDWRRPSPKLRRLRRLEVWAIFGPLVVLAVIPAAATGDVTPGAITAGVLIAVGALLDWMLGRRVRAWMFTERADDLIVSRGVMFRRLSVVPYGRMQFVDVTAGPLERIFGLATVRLHTAAAASDARIPGLAAEDAGRLRDQLSSLGESRLAGL